MQWTKQGKYQVAQGKLGRFVIRKAGLYCYAYYYGEKNFTLPRKRYIKDLKEMCQNNFYWENT